MKRLVLALLVTALVASTLVAPTAVPAFAATRVVKTKVVRTPARKTVRKTVVKGPKRTVVVVRRGFPIHRSMPLVVVRAPRNKVVIVPRTYLPRVMWQAMVVAVPPRSRLVWEDSEKLMADDDWTEFTLNVNDTGRALYLGLQGWVQIDFAEVVFGNGQSQVVDFDRRARADGSYLLLDFKDGRRIAYVRMVARAKRDGAKVRLHMAK